MSYIQSNTNKEKIEIYNGYDDGVTVQKGQKQLAHINTELWRKLLQYCRKDYDNNGEIAKNTVGKNGEMIDIKWSPDGVNVILEYLNDPSKAKAKVIPKGKYEISYKSKVKTKAKAKPKKIEFSITMQFVTWYYIVMENTETTNEGEQCKPQAIDWVLEDTEAPLVEENVPEIAPVTVPDQAFEDLVDGELE